jgi:hypothetical protein
VADLLTVPEQISRLERRVLELEARLDALLPRLGGGSRPGQLPGAPETKPGPTDEGKR